MTDQQRENIARGKEPTMPIGLTETEIMRKIRIRREIINTLKDGILDPADEYYATTILDAIEAGLIPHVKIDWSDEA